MIDINHATISGTITAAPELTILPSSTPLCTFRVALRGRARGRSFRQREIYDLVDVSALRDLAERCARTLTEGSRVVVDGHLRWGHDLNQGHVGVVAHTVEIIETTHHVDAEPISAVE
jgi:single-stranded DNA-binding protein